MEALVEKHLSTVHDWERNFKALKIKGKEVERLPRYWKLELYLCTVTVSATRWEGYSSLGGVEVWSPSYLL